MTTSSATPPRRGSICRDRERLLAGDQGDTPVSGFGEVLEDTELKGLDGTFDLYPVLA